MNMKTEEVKKEIATLIKILKQADKDYLREGVAGMSDAEYDQLYARLQALEEAYPSLISRSSPTNQIISPRSKKPLFAHKVPMLSIQKAYELNDVGRLKALASGGDLSVEFVAEEKIDGLGISFIYLKGKFTRCVTRGDGKVGHDVTVHAKTIQGLPLTIDTGAAVVEVRGELFVTKQDFQKANNANQYSNPRNFVSSVIMRNKPGATPIQYFAFDLGGSRDEIASSQSQCLKTLEMFGFRVMPNHLVFTDLADLRTYYNSLKKGRKTMPYEIDGIVVKVDDFSLQKKLGTTHKHPRYSVAVKFPALLAFTKVQNIEITIGRSGILTPVAKVAPVEIGGVSIERASLYNFKVVKQLDVRVGDTVELVRAGDVIPKISKVVKAERPSNTDAVVPPSHCPGCNAPLSKQYNTLTRLKCLNEFNCQPQLLRKLEHITSKDALDIDGVAQSKLLFLLENGFIDSIPDFFTFYKKEGEYNRLCDAPGWSKRSVSNLVAQIEAKKSPTLARFIFALGINEVGSLRSEILADYLLTPNRFLDIMKDLTKDVANDLSEIPNLGPSCILQLKLFSKVAANVVLVEALLNTLTVQPVVLPRTGDGNLVEDAPKTESHILTGKTLVFSGKLSVPRRQAAQMAVEMGAKVGKTVTKVTDFLVVGDSPGKKASEAQALNIKMISDRQFQTLYRRVAPVLDT